MTHPPKSLQGILWSTSVDLLDIEKDKGYIIHQLLTYGTFDQLRWLFQTYSRQTIIDVFIHEPVKMYPKSVYLFVKNFILPLRNTQLDEQNYVTSIFGPIRPRAAGRIS